MTSRNNGIRERIVSGLAERGYTLKEMLSTSLGASGSVVFKGEYEGRPVALKLASYGLLNSFAGDNVEKLEDFRRREIETLRLAGNHSNIPNYVESFSIDGDNQDPIYALVMEYLDYPSIAARIKAGERVSDEEAKILLKDGLSAEDYLHTGLPTRVLHRDIKTQNILINGEKAYLIDFDIVKQGDRDSTRATQIEANGYYPPDFYRGTEEAQRPEHDVVALGNVAIAGISGKEIGPLRYEQGLYGLEPVDTSRLNVSSKIRDYLAKMIAIPGKRFQTAREALEGLEKIIGSPVALQPVSKPEPQTSLVPMKTGEVAKTETSGLLEVMETSDGGSVIIDGFIFDKKNNVYETAKNIYNYIGEHKIRYLGNRVSTHKDFLGNNLEFTLFYLQHAAQNGFPILQEVAERKATLEGMLGEKGPLWEYLTTKKFDFALGNFTFYITPQDDISYSQIKQSYNQRRQELMGVFGMEEHEGLFRYINPGSFIGMPIIGLPLSILTSYALYKLHGSPVPFDLEFIPWVVGQLGLGAIVGSNIQRYTAKRKLPSQAREMDSWFRQARNSQIPLEKRVEMAELTGKEERGLTMRSVLYSSALSIASQIGVYSVGQHFLEVLNPIFGGAGVITALGIFYGIKHKLENHLTSRAKKKKRRELGLPEDGLYYTETLEIDGRENKFIPLLKERGIKDKFLKSELVGDGVKVSFDHSFYQLKPAILKFGEFMGDYHHTDIKIRAASKEKLEETIEALKPLALPSGDDENPETPEGLSGRGGSTIN